MSSANKHRTTVRYDTISVAIPCHGVSINVNMHPSPLSAQRRVQDLHSGIPEGLAETFSTILIHNYIRIHDDTRMNK